MVTQRRRRPEPAADQPRHTAVQIGLNIGNRTVALSFPEPITWIAFSPESAYAIGAQLMEHAKELGYDGDA